MIFTVTSASKTTFNLIKNSRFLGLKLRKSYKFAQKSFVNLAPDPYLDNCSFGFISIRKEDYFAFADVCA